AKRRHERGARRHHRHRFRLHRHQPSLRRALPHARSPNEDTMSEAAMTRREWLLTDRPQSRLQARLGHAYVAWRRFTANRLAVLGLLIILGLVFLAIFAPLLAPHSP